MEDAELDHGVAVGRLRIDVAAWVYGTVTMMSVLVVYDGWGDQKRYLGVVAVVVAPVLALGLAHLFADVLDFHVRRHRPPSRHEWIHMLEHATQYLLVAVPPLVVLVVTGWLPGVDLRGSVVTMVWFSALSLGFWGWFAGRRAGLRGWRLLASSLAGLLVGLVVILLQVLLKPH
ncbi:MAG: hypothetical protein U0S36_01365 [Candidatus Nanopelagicales bacterium]